MVAIPKNAKRYIVQSIPAELNPSDEHFQVFDSYIGEEGLHLRKCRNPATDERTFGLLRSRLGIALEEFEISPDEYPRFQEFRNRELRFNRYSFEGKIYDVFLGALKGLVISYSTGPAPDLVVREITDDNFFSGSNLQILSIEDIKKRIGQ